MKWTRTKTETHTDYRAANGEKFAHIMQSRKGGWVWGVCKRDGTSVRHGGARTLTDAKRRCEELMINHEQAESGGGE